MEKLDELDGEKETRLANLEDLIESAEYEYSLKLERAELTENEQIRMERPLMDAMDKPRLDMASHQLEEARKISSKISNLPPGMQH